MEERKKISVKDMPKLDGVLFHTKSFVKEKWIIKYYPETNCTVWKAYREGKENIFSKGSVSNTSSFIRYVNEGTWIIEYDSLKDKIIEVW